MSGKPFDVDAVKARCEAATPGPWVRGFGHEAQSSIVVSPESRDDVPDVALGDGTTIKHPAATDPSHPGCKTVFLIQHRMFERGNDADLTFTAHARTDLPAALAEIKRLSAVDAAWCESSRALLAEIEQQRARIKQMQEDAKYTQYNQEDV